MYGIMVCVWGIEWLLYVSVWLWVTYIQTYSSQFELLKVEQIN